MYARTSKTSTCQKKGILLDKISSEYYYEKDKMQEQQNKYYESAKCQDCKTLANTSEEVDEKFGFKQNGERYTRCKTCMKQICVWKECNNEKQP